MRIDAFQLLFKGFQHFANTLLGVIIPRLQEPIFLLVDQLQQRIATSDQGGVLLFVVRLHGRGLRLRHCRETGDDLGVDQIRFGIRANALGEIANSPRIDDSV